MTTCVHNQTCVHQDFQIFILDLHHLFKRLDLLGEHVLLMVILTALLAHPLFFDGHFRFEYVNLRLKYCVGLIQIGDDLCGLFKLILIRAEDVLLLGIVLDGAPRPLIPTLTL